MKSLQFVFLFLFNLGLFEANASDLPLCEDSTRYSMDTSYLEEEVETFIPSIAPSLKPKKSKVTYLSKNGRKKYLLSLLNDVPFQGSAPIEKSIYRLSPIKKIFIVDLDKQIFLGDGVPYKFHHSSFVSAFDVRAAGNLLILLRQIVYIDNYSGHYKPDKRSNVVMLDTLLSLGFKHPANISFVKRSNSKARPTMVNLDLEEAIDFWKSNEEYVPDGFIKDILPEIKRVLIKHGVLKVKPST